MKKLLLLVHMMVLPLTLVACDNGGDVDPQPAESGSTEQTNGDSGEFGGESIVLWIDEPAYGEALEEALSLKFPDSNFEFQEVNSTDALDMMRLDGPAGLAGDIMIIPHTNLVEGVQEMLFLPFSPDLEARINSDFAPNTVESIKVDENYFAIPLAIETIAMFYNKTLLEEHDLTVAESFEEIIEQAAVFNDPTNDDFILRWDVSDSYFDTIFLTAFGYELFGPNHDDADLINFDTPEVLAGLEFYLSLRDILPVEAADLDWSNTFGEFMAGNVPYHLSGRWAVAELSVQDDFEWGAVVIPTIGGERPLPFAGNQVAVASSFTDHPELVREVLDFMMSDEGLQLAYDHRGSVAPLLDTSKIAGLDEDPGSLALLEQANNHAMPMPAIPELSHFWPAADQMFESVWNGLLTPQEAVDNAMEQFEISRTLVE